VVRNGYLPERKIQTGIGAIPVKVPKVRDRSGNKVKFQSSLLPPYLRRTKRVEELLPWLYLKGISTGAFPEALSALLGERAEGLSPSVISRLKKSWEEEHQAWSQRDLSDTEYVYIWADGVYFGVRAEESKQCILVLLGATKDGRKELVALSDGYRESEQSWTDLLSELKERGLKQAPKLGIGDGALGFWKALSKEFPETVQQRCWVHKTQNILNKLPKGEQEKAKSRIHDIFMASTKENAVKAFERFIKSYSLKYQKATDCLQKDKDVLFSFYDFPAEQWQHIRTTNPIESIFATVKLRTAKTRGCVSRASILAMVFKLTMSASKKWRKLRGYEQIAKVIDGVQFRDGEEVFENEQQNEGAIVNRKAA
jgi:putative transposase